MTLQLSSPPTPRSSQPIPIVAVFEAALAAYRERWPKDGYISTRQRFVETYRLLRQAYRGGEILDVGGWPGDFACTLASLHLDVTVLDKDLSRPISKRHDATSGKWVLDGLTTLDDRCGALGIKVLEADIEREPIPLADCSVDLIVFTEVIEHLRTGLLNALREMRRVLKPEGQLLVSTPNLLSLQNRVSFLLGRARYDTLDMPFDALAAEERIGHGGHFRVFSLPELVHLFEMTGFRIVCSEYQNIRWADADVLGWSLYDMRVRAKDWVSRTIAPLGNTIFIVAARA